MGHKKSCGDAGWCHFQNVLKRYCTWYDVSLVFSAILRHIGLQRWVGQAKLARTHQLFVQLTAANEPTLKMSAAIRRGSKRSDTSEAVTAIHVDW
eukprot:s1732_g15.t1